jgi:hypothetical protein
MCGEVYRSWSIVDVKRLRTVLTLVLIERGETPVANERIFPPAED